MGIRAIYINTKLQLRYYLYHCVVDAISDLVEYTGRLLRRRDKKPSPGYFENGVIPTENIEEDTLSAKESLQVGLEDAAAGRTYPVETLWENVYADEPPSPCKD